MRVTGGTWAIRQRIERRMVGSSGKKLKKCAQCDSPISERKRYCCDACKQAAYRDRKEKGIKGKAGAPTINGKPMTDAEYSRRYYYRQKSKGERHGGASGASGPSGPTVYLGVKDTVPIFIGLDGESVEGKDIPYKETERYRENQRIEKAWNEYIAYKTEEEIWDEFKRVIKMDLGGVKLADWNRSDWERVVPVHMRRNETGTQIDKIVRDLRRYWPQFGVKDQHDLWEKFSRFQEFGNRRKPRYPGRHPKEPKSISEPDNYVLLAASDGSEIADFENGLSTRQCFDYLLDLSERHGGSTWKRNAPKVRFLWFYMDYDVNMILLGLPEDALRQLRKYKTARWYFDPEKNPDLYYCISWTPGKRFSVSLKRARPPVYNEEKGKWDRKDETLRAFSSYDIGGFFQTSFVNACLGWGILTEEDDGRLPFIEEMKEKRGKFSQLSEDVIRRYNRIEVELIAEMGKRLWESHRDLGLHLGSMHGAGATASLLLNKHGIHEHLKDSMPPDVRDKVYRGYFGGRIQLHRVGRFEGIHAYDINSAYPHGMAQLPSLKDSRWVKADQYDPNLWALWRVRWDLGELKEGGHGITPFPFRDENGHIYWLRKGEGWYWNPEVSAALKHFPGKVEVIEGVALHLPNGHVRPFAFVEDLYGRRRALKEGDGYDIREKVIKLGLNALYGKVAEGAHVYGRRGGKDNIRKPKFQSYVYAGLITSMTRARLLDAAMLDPCHVIAFATDCVFSRVLLPLELSDALGGWSSKGLRVNGLFVQPGVYRLEEPGGKEISHTRGFMPSEFDWSEVSANFDAVAINPGCNTFTFPSRRFIGLGAALHGRMDEWCTWVETERELAVFSARTSPSGWDAVRLLRERHAGGGESAQFGESVIVEPERIHSADGEESAPYKPKHELNIEGEPYLDLEQEILRRQIMGRAFGTW